MSKEEIKKEKFKAVPEGATTEQHDFEAEYKKSDQYLVKDKDGKYKIFEKSKRVPGTLKDLDEKKNQDKFKEESSRGRKFKEESGGGRKIEDNEKLCDFVCENCDKLKTGQCKEEYTECDTCGEKITAVYYRKQTEKGDMVFRKPFSAKKKE